MRTKSVDEKESEMSPDTILADADREELEQLRAERDARNSRDKAIEDAQKKEATSCTINLPPAAGNFISVAGNQYFHGKSYQVSNDLKWVLEEAQRRCWSHEASLHESSNKARRPQAMQL
jgi:hypothetical protein